MRKGWHRVPPQPHPVTFPRPKLRAARPNSAGGKRSGPPAPWKGLCVLLLPRQRRAWDLWLLVPPIFPQGCSQACCLQHVWGGHYVSWVPGVGGCQAPHRTPSPWTGDVGFAKREEETRVQEKPPGGGLDLMGRAASGLLPTLGTFSRPIGAAGPGRRWDGAVVTPG